MGLAVSPHAAWSGVTFLPTRRHLLYVAAFAFGSASVHLATVLPQRTDYAGAVGPRTAPNAWWGQPNMGIPIFWTLFTTQ